MKLSKTATYNFYSDPSHGWLRVPMAHVDELGIRDRISAYSYKNGKWAYLEEDCDYRVFEEAFKEKFDIYPAFMRKNPARDWSSIRSYDFFQTNILIDTKPSKTEMSNKVNRYVGGNSISFKGLMSLDINTVETMYNELAEAFK